MRGPRRLGPAGRCSHTRGGAPALARGVPGVRPGRGEGRAGPEPVREPLLRRPLSPGPEGPARGFVSSGRASGAARGPWGPAGLAGPPRWLVGDARADPAFRRLVEQPPAASLLLLPSRARKVFSWCEGPFAAGGSQHESGSFVRPGRGRSAPSPGGPDGWPARSLTFSSFLAALELTSLFCC